MSNANRTQGERDCTADILQVQFNLSMYAYGIDQQDWDLVSSTFLDGAEVDYDTLPAFPRGVPDFVGHLRDLFKALKVTQHHIGSIATDIQGNRGHCSSYVLATHVGHDGRVFTSAGRYDDTVARTSSGWRIATRRFRRQWGVDPDGLGADLKIGKLMAPLASDSSSFREG